MPACGLGHPARRMQMTADLIFEVQVDFQQYMCASEFFSYTHAFSIQRGKVCTDFQTALIAFKAER